MPTRSRAHTLGPRVGAVTGTTAKIWVRGCQVADVNVQYRAPDAAGWGEVAAAAAKTDLANDGTAVVQLTGLQPKTSYTYRVTHRW